MMNSCSSLCCPRQKAIASASEVRDRERFAEELLQHAMDLYVSPHGPLVTPGDRCGGLPETKVLPGFLKKTWANRRWMWLMWPAKSTWD